MSHEYYYIHEQTTYMSGFFTVNLIDRAKGPLFSAATNIVTLG